MHVTPLGLDTETFNPHASFTGCQICGEVFQSELDRKTYLGYASPAEQIQATVQRRNWSQWHASHSHTQKEHDMLAASGRFCTPEAAMKLAPLGIVTMSDNVFSVEHEQAQAEAPRTPVDEPVELTAEQIERYTR